MSGVDSENWELMSSAKTEQSLAKVADWGPAEDWTDWHDAMREV
jgi:hypothetical protein